MPIYLLGSSGVLGRSLGVLFGSMPLAERNLATMWSNYRALGYRRLVYLNTASVLPKVIDGLTAAMGDAPSVWDCGENNSSVYTAQTGDGTDWRRTRIAVDDCDRMIGCASIVHNPLHPTWLPCAIGVAPTWRRRGIGTALLQAAKELRDNVSRPLSTKARASDAAATAFLTGQGGLAYQSCSAAVIDADDPSALRWVNAQSAAARRPRRPRYGRDSGSGGPRPRPKRCSVA